MSFILVLLYIFCTIIRPQDWVPGITGVGLINMLALGAMFFLIVERSGRRKLNIVRVPQNLLMVGLYICIIMSHVSHTYVYGVVFSSQAFLSNFILYFILLNGINSEMKFKVTNFLMIGLVTSLVFQGMSQLELGYGWAGQPLTVHGGKLSYQTVRINWIGIFNDPNDLALLFVIMVGMVLAMTFGNRGTIARLYNLAILGTLCYGIYLTNSRGGFLALLTTVYFFFVRRTKRFVIGGIIGGVMASGILLYGPSRMSEVNLSEASAFSRVELWYQGILMLKSNPLFGVGYDMFMEEVAQTAHSSFILAAAELGFIGLFLWMALFYCSFKGLSIIQANDAKLYNYALGLQSALVGFSAAAFFLSRTYIILPYMLFAFSGSLMHIARERNPELDFHFTKKDFKVSIWLSIGILLLSYIVIKVAL